MTNHFTMTEWPPSVEVKLLGLGVQRVGNGYIITKNATPWESPSAPAVLIAMTPAQLADIIQEWAESIEATEKIKNPPMPATDRIPGGTKT